MIKYDIKSGKLYTDLDTPYDNVNNKIDVYSSCYWSAKNEKDYTKKETIINSYKVENKLIKLNAWCDTSGFDYWVKELQEDNYVSIDVVLKKSLEEYTQKEMQEIGEIIVEADEFFNANL